MTCLSQPIEVYYKNQLLSTFHRLGALWEALSPSKKSQTPSFLLSKNNSECTSFLQAFWTTQELEWPSSALLKELRELKQPIHDSPLSFFSFSFQQKTTENPNVPFFCDLQQGSFCLSSGVDFCVKNLNWDGMDRLEDLRDQSFLSLQDEIVWIHRQPLVSFFRAELERWIRLLELFEQRQLVYFLPQKKSDSISVFSHLRASHSLLRRVGVSLWDETTLKAVESWLASLSLPQMQNSILWDECVSFWGIFLWQHWQGELKGPSEGLFWISAEGYETQIRTWIQPFLEKGKVPSFCQRFSFLRGHFRQQKIIEECFFGALHPELLRRKVAYRMLFSLDDVRVDSFVLEQLPFETDDEILYLQLKKIHQSVLQKKIQEEDLLWLAEHPKDSICSMAWRILAQRNPLEVFRVIEKQCIDLKRHSLLYFAHELLASGKESKESERLRKKLPKAKLQDQSLPSFREDIHVDTDFRWIPDWLENSINPTRIRFVLELFLQFPHLPERQVLGSALANPEKKWKQKAIALLSQSTQLEAIQLLQSRLLLEEEPSIQKEIKEAILEAQEKRKKTQNRRGEQI